MPLPPEMIDRIRERERERHERNRPAAQIPLPTPEMIYPHTDTTEVHDEITGRVVIISSKIVSRTGRSLFLGTR